MALSDGVTGDAVRGALDQELTATALPDAIIERPLFRGRALRYVEQRLPVAFDTLGATAQAAATNAAVLLAAAYLVPTLPQYTQEDVDGAGWRRDWIKPEERVRQLEAAAAAELDVVAAEEGEVAPPYTRPSFFTTASGTRGQ